MYIHIIYNLLRPSAAERVSGAAAADDEGLAAAAPAPGGRNAVMELGKVQGEPLV